MIYELRLMKKHYTRDFLIKDIFSFCFALLVDWILTSGSLWLIEEFIQCELLFMFSTMVIYIVFIIFPFFFLYNSIDENIKEIKRSLRKNANEL